MKKYTVEITETLTRLVSIEAENPDEAERLVREKYKSCEIVLDADDFQDYETSIYEYMFLFCHTKKRFTPLFLISFYDLIRHLGQ